MAPKKAPVDPDDAPLKRLGGGRWQTRDERFTIEPQSGTWVVVDAEQTDDLGLPLVRGPFPSLSAAKEAISAARSAQPVESPLTAQIERRRRRPAPEPDEPASEKRRPAEAARAQRDHGRRPAAEPESREPGWLRELEPADRGRARRIIERLAEQGASDPEGLVRRDVVGADATPDEIAEILVEGRDPELGVRWRLVDGEGRPIVLERGGRGTRRR
jgi:hypothetical protein